METKYFVYTHTTPDGMVYVGVTRDIKTRWKPHLYRGKNGLNKYIKFFGWENIEHKVICEFDNLDEALRCEDDLIMFCRANQCCINIQRSGNIEKNRTIYMRHWRKENAEHSYNYMKNYRSTRAWRLYDRVKDYNRWNKLKHPERIIETPLEARRKYVEYGYIPDYIKNKNDL